MITESEDMSGWISLHHYQTAGVAGLAYYPSVSILSVKFFYTFLTSFSFSANGKL